MKPAKFEYHVPGTLDEAAETLGSLVEESDAKILAGGQSLIPLMNMRLSQPEHVIDLRSIPELQAFSADASSVRVGSMVTQRQLEQSATVSVQNPLLTYAVHHIAHFQIRERGTVGGSIAHADPSAELPLMAVLLDASVEVLSSTQHRRVPASDFFISFLTTDLEEDEIIREIQFRSLQAGEGWGFREFSRRLGDFALVAAAATVHMSDGTYDSMSLGFSGVTDVPTVVPDLKELVVGEEPSQQLWREIARRAADMIEPTSSAHASAEDRRELIRHLGSQALADSTTRAMRGDSAPEALTLP